MEGGHMEAGRGQGGRRIYPPLRSVPWIAVGVLIGVLVFATWRPAHALPEYAARTGQQCSTCHVNPAGGGPRTLRGLLWLAQGRPDEVPPLPGAQEEAGPAVLDGPTLFSTKYRCARCHGAVGQGGVAPALNQKERSRDELVDIIRNGVGAMKGFGSGAPSDEEMDILVPYLQAIGRGEVEAGLELRKRLLPPPRLMCGVGPVVAAEYSEDAPRLFQRYCGGCHMVDGVGGTRGPDLSAVGTYRDAEFLEKVIRNPSEVLPGAGMPGFENTLDRGTIQDLANYLTAQLSAADALSEAKPTPEPASVSYAAQIVPILGTACAPCHGGVKTYASFDVRSYDSLMTTGRSRPVIIPGDSGHSLLFLTLVDKALTVDRMPMSGLLTTRQIQLIQHWIDQGAQRN